MTKVEIETKIANLLVKYGYYNLDYTSANRDSVDIADVHDMLSEAFGGEPVEESHYATIAELKGQVINMVDTDNKTYIKFYTDKGCYKMYHDQDCCESVTIDDINGDLKSLEGQRVEMADERSNHDNKKSSYDDSFTWTFYTLGTVKGYIDIRWYGTSKLISSSIGYYSERVDLWFEPVVNR